MGTTLAELARRCHGQARGQGDLSIEGVAPLDSAGPQEIAYVADRKYLKSLSRTKAGAVILSPTDAENYPGNALIVDNPQLCFARIGAWLHPLPPVQPGRHPTALVDPAAEVATTVGIGPYVVIEARSRIGERVFIGAGSFVGRGAIIGDGTHLAAHVVIGERCVIGRDCLLHPGVVIGSDGFGYAKDDTRWVKISQLGSVVIGDEVDIGANTTIDRGTLTDTIIGDRVKLDNLIQIAHNVRIGEDTAMAACVGVAGSAVIGKRCAIGGQVGIAGHVEITDDVQIMATSLVTSSINEPGAYSSSIKAAPLASWRKNAVRLHQLDEMARRLRQLEMILQQRVEEHKN